MVCPLCASEINYGASVCAHCGATRVSQVRGIFSFLAFIGYFWVIYEAFTHLPAVGALITSLSPPFAAWLRESPFGSLVAGAAILVVPFIAIVALLHMPMFAKAVWVRRLG
jgi:hypothetical protein